MGRSTRRLSAAAVLATGMLFAGCSDGPTEISNNDPEPRGDPPEFTWDPTIPEIPQPLAPQPMTQAFSAAGEIVDSVSLGEPPNAVAVGVFNLSVECKWPDDGYVDCRDGPADTSYFAQHNAFMQVLAEHPEVTTAFCEPTATPVDGGGGQVVAYVWATYCVTFHDIAVTGEVGLRHDRLWRNVTSRVLGPGTTYSVTYRWTEGVETSNGFEWSSTTGSKTMHEDTWNNCIGGSVKVAAETGVDAGILSGKTTVEAEVHDEYCFGAKSAQETSQSLTNTLSETQTVSSERGGEETTAVSGGDNSDRVYTVWQLVDRYTYVTADAGSLVPLEASDVSKVPGFQSLRDSSAFANSPEWRLVDVIWPAPLHQNTQLFAQLTRDFPIQGSASQSQIRYLRPGPQL